MAYDLDIACRCGALRFAARAVDPAVASCVVCECQGCRDFAHRMGASEILDADGGTGRIQISPASLVLREGAEHLACMQQTRGGALRWYAACCQTPMVLTLPNPSVPFVGIDRARVRWPEGVAPEQVIGPMRAGEQPGAGALSSGAAGDPGAAPGDVGPPRAPDAAVVVAGGRGPVPVLRAGGPRRPGAGPAAGRTQGSAQRLLLES